MNAEPKELLNQVRELIYRFAGIHLAENKDSFITNRLGRLSKDLEIADRTEILHAVAAGRYRQEFINAFTTNKTDFFRESFHFHDMIDRVLPRFCQKEKLESAINIYCAASATGEEPYSIAASLLHGKRLYGCDCLTPSILATDIDTEVLKIAQCGEYIVNTQLNPLPTWLDLSSYFELRPLEDSTKIALRARECLRSIVDFKILNLFDSRYALGRAEFDIIFCRNVLIYFKVADQEKILERLFGHLKVGGTLYLGHSEQILSLQGRVDRLGHNIFIKRKD